MQRRLASGLVVLIAAAAAAGVSMQREPRSLRDVAVAAAKRDGGDTRATLWFVFRPSDCITNTARFDTLNALSALRRVTVRGVILLDDPKALADIDKLTPLFGAEFEVMPDARSEWRDAVARAGVTVPFYFLQNIEGELTVLSPGELDVGTPAFETLAGDIPEFERALNRRRKHNPTRRHFLSPGVDQRPRVREQGIARLERPEGLSANAHGIAMYDFGDARLKVLDHDGRAVWMYPVDGDTAHPLMSVSDIKIWEDTVGVLEAEGSSIVVFSPTGTRVRTIRLSRPVSRFARTTGALIVAIDEDHAEVGAYVFDMTGRLIREIPLSADLKGLPSLVREVRITELPGSDSVLIAFRNASQIWMLDPRDGGHRAFPGAEDVAFPKLVGFSGRAGAIVMRLDPRAVRATIAVHADETRVYALFGGATADANRQVDVFERGSGRYVGTYRLARAATDMVKVRGGFITVGPVSGSGLATLDRWQEPRTPGVQKRPRDN